MWEAHSWEIRVFARRTAIFRLVSYLRRTGIEYCEIADPFIQSQVDPY
jgi:hypothetical protein